MGLQDQNQGAQHAAHNLSCDLVLQLFVRKKRVSSMFACVLLHDVGMCRPQTVPQCSLATAPCAFAFEPR